MHVLVGVGNHVLTLFTTNSSLACIYCELHTAVMSCDTQTNWVHDYLRALLTGMPRIYKGTSNL